MFCVAVVHQTLEDDVVRLRTFRPGDLEFLYSLLATPEIGLRSRTRGVTPSPDEFRQLIWRDAFVLFIVDSVTTGQCLGYVSAYNANMRNGIAYLAAMGSQRSVGRGLVVRGLAILIRYLFTNWPFRKLYFESAEPSFEQFASALPELFVEEGRLREVEYREGSYSDVIVGAISRARWDLVTTKRGVSVSGAAARLAVGDDGPIFEAISRQAEPWVTIALDDFLSLVAELAGHELEMDESLFNVGLDSLQMLELACVIEELTGNPLDLDAEISSDITIRELYLKYCEKASMPLTGQRSLDSSTQTP